MNISEFTRKLDALSKAYTKMPNEIAAIAVKFSKERFRSQAWLDQSSEAWKPRAKRREGGPKKSQTLLVNTGRLKRSIRKISANENNILIGTDVPYAQAQNDGFKGNVTQQVKSHKRALTKKGITSRKQLKRSTRIEFGRIKTGETTVKTYRRTIKQNIPPRQFIGNSQTLQNQIIEHITNNFKTALNK